MAADSGTWPRSALDGVPKMSSNCVERLDEALSGAASYLEWGSGNSTLHVLELHPQVRTVVSVEHHCGWYAALLGALLTRLGATISRLTIGGLGHRLQPLDRIRDRAPHLESDLVRLHYLGGAKTLGAERTNTSPAAVARRLVHLALRGRIGKRRHGEGQPEEVLESGEDLLARLEAMEGEDVLVQVAWDERKLEYILARPFRRDGQVSNDGLYAELYDYVDLGLDGTFDVILVDGRARPSVLKRVHRDGLLAGGGTLFCHDAYRASLYEALSQYSGVRYIDGDNRLLTGEPFTSPAEARFAGDGLVKDEMAVVGPGARRGERWP